ncbi:MAG: hypothetical protein AAGF12_05050 [Myxococcota bacterium]
MHHPKEPLLGRQTELQHARDRLDHGDQLITVLGGGGVGKTRFAQQLLAEARDAERKVFFCDAGHTHGPSDVVAVAATSLGGVNAQSEDAIASVGARLATWPAPLVVIDNLEHVAATVGPIVETWLECAPEAQIIATSRVALNTPTERLLRLKPLSTQWTSDEPPVAARLFMQCCRRRDLDVNLRDEPALREVTELLGGIPLAIELAAARMGVLTLSQLGQHLRRDPLQVLRDATGGGDRCVQSAFSASYELLPNHARRALAQCSVFRGPFDLRDAQAVLIGSEPLVDSLQLLVEHALVERDEDSFRLLHPIAAFARHLGGDELSEVRARHLTWYGTNAKRIHKRLEEGHGAARAELTHHQANFLAAAHYGFESDGVVQAVNIVRVLTSPLYQGLPSRMQVEWLNRGLEFAGELPDAVVAELEFQRGFARDRAVPSDRRSALTEVYERVASEQKRAPNPKLMGRLLCRLSAFDADQWSGSDARQKATEALAYSKTSGDHVYGSLSHLALSAAHLIEGDCGKAFEEGLSAIAVARRLHDESLLGHCLMSAGKVKLWEARTDEAEPYLEEARQVFDRGTPTPRQGLVDELLAVIARLRGDFPTALARMRQAERWARSAGWNRTANDLLGMEAEVERAAGNDRRAVALIDEALSGTGTAANAVLHRAIRASSLSSLGRLDEASFEYDSLEKSIGSHWPTEIRAAIEVERGHLFVARAFAARTEADREHAHARVRTILERADEVFRQTPNIDLALGIDAVRRRFDGTPSARPPLVLSIDQDRREIEFDGRQLPCRRRPILWRLVTSLALPSAHPTPQRLTADDLIGMVWSGERMSPSSGRNRLYVEIASARRQLGAELIEAVDGGYRLGDGIEVQLTG